MDDMAEKERVAAASVTSSDTSSDTSSKDTSSDTSGRHPRSSAGALGPGLSVCVCVCVCVCVYTHTQSVVVIDDLLRARRGQGCLRRGV